MLVPLLLQHPRHVDVHDGEHEKDEDHAGECPGGNPAGAGSDHRETHEKVDAREEVEQKHAPAQLLVERAVDFHGQRGASTSMRRSRAASLSSTPFTYLWPSVPP